MLPYDVHLLCNGEKVEAQYKQLLAVDGPAAAADPVFPAAYPTRCLLGCVDVAAVLSSEELQRLNLTKSLRMVRLCATAVIMLNEQTSGCCTLLSTPLSYTLKSCRRVKPIMSSFVKVQSIW